MSDKNKKRFGIWMDLHQATIVGRKKSEAGEFVILAHEKVPVRKAIQMRMLQITATER